jgi:hypothetical protein
MAFAAGMGKPIAGIERTGPDPVTCGWHFAACGQGLPGRRAGTSHPPAT